MMRQSLYEIIVQTKNSQQDQHKRAQNDSMETYL